jgi:hypothetical protein
MSSRPNVAELVAAGYGVGRLRTAGVSPAEIRAEGFSLEEMYKHLGIPLLIEAGFQLEDFRRANFSINQILGAFPLDRVLREYAGAYTLKDLITCVSPQDLITLGNFTADDFYQVGDVPAAELRQYGFSQTEIDAAVALHPPARVTPGAHQPPHASTMSVDEEWSQQMDDSRGLSVTYKRLPKEEAIERLANPIVENRRISSSSNYGYGGSGHLCPRCGRLFVLLYKSATSEDMHADEEGTWICDDPDCGMMKNEKYTGYGTIF